MPTVTALGEFFEDLMAGVKQAIPFDYTFFWRKKTPASVYERAVKTARGEKVRNLAYCQGWTNAKLETVLRYLQGAEQQPFYGAEDFIVPPFLDDLFAATFLFNTGAENPLHLYRAFFELIESNPDFEITNRSFVDEFDPHHKRMMIQGIYMRGEGNKIMFYPVELLVKTVPDYLEAQMFYCLYKGCYLPQQEVRLRERMVREARGMRSKDELREALFYATKNLYSSLLSSRAPVQPDQLDGP